MNTAAKTKIEAVEADTDSELPEGWALAKLPQIAEINMGQSPPGSTYNEDRKGLPFFQGKADFGERWPTVRIWCTEPKKIAKRSDVLISVRAPVGPTNIADRDCCIGRGLAAISPLGKIPTEYMLFGLRLQEPELSLSGSGSTFTAINKQDLEDVALAVAPLKEQSRIVLRVEEALARVKTLKEHLTKGPTLLKYFRQAVLATACSGKLTEDWRRETNSTQTSTELLAAILGRRKEILTAHRHTKYAEPYQPNGWEEEFPKTWASATIDQLTSLVTSGSRGWARYYSNAGPLFIRAENINCDYLDMQNIAHVHPPKGVEGIRTRVQTSDLLITITGANVTKSALVDREIGEAYVSQHIGLVRPVEILTAAYLYLWIVSPIHGRRKLVEDAYGAGKPGLNLDNIREMPVALPPLEEQKEIVHRVEGFFTLADAIERRVSAATFRAGKLIT